MQSSEFDYDTLTEQVQLAGLGLTVSEIQGIACGLACAQVPEMEKQWYVTLFSEVDTESPEVAECRRSLDALLKESVSSFGEEEFGLALLLPGENQATSLRAAAIRDWCQGFLFGFGLAGEQPASLFSQDAGEALQDFAEISRLDVETEDDEETEAALAELEEYLWVAALLIHQDIMDRGEGTQG